MARAALLRCVEGGRGIPACDLRCPPLKIEFGEVNCGFHPTNGCAWRVEALGVAESRGAMNKGLGTANFCVEELADLDNDY